MASAVNTFGSLSAPNTSLCHWFAGGKTSLSYTEAKNRKASGYLQDCIAVNIGVAGRLYVTASSSASSATLYKIRILRGNSDDTQSFTQASDTTGHNLIILDGTISKKSTPVVYSVAITKAGTYWITATGAYNVHAVCFIPTTDKQRDVTKNISIPTVGWATFSAPQNFTWTDENLKAYYVSGHDAEKVTLAEIDKSQGIPACTGVLLYKVGGGDITLTSAESTTTSITTNYLKANLAAYTLGAATGSNENFVLVKNKSTAAVEFARINENSASLGAGKSYLQVPTGGLATRGLSFGGTTSISPLVVNSNSVTDNAYYNLKGQRVDNPTKGLYIHNGKKIFFK